MSLKRIASIAIRKVSIIAATALGIGAKAQVAMVTATRLGKRADTKIGIK